MNSTISSTFGLPALLELFSLSPMVILLELPTQDFQWYCSMWSPLSSVQKFQVTIPKMNIQFG